MPVHVLGISAFYHDSAAALLRDGEVVAAAQEERFTRRKGDPSFPEAAVACCLREAGIRVADLDHVVFYEKPWIHFERLLETYLAFAPRGIRSFLAAMPAWLGGKLTLARRIRDDLDRDGPVLFTEHHEAHMASAFYPSPFDRAAVLTVDGVGEWATTSWGVGDGARIEPRAEIHFPHSLGLLYSAFTYYLGFRVNSGEYKVMGLAPYGEPRYRDVILDRLIDLREDGSFRMDMGFFDYATGLRMTNARFADLFGGPPRDPEGALEARHMDVARSIQAVAEEALLRMCRHVHRESGESRLVLAGGVALNCVANGRILRETPFADLWVQPAAGDAGGALGAALAAWHGYLGNPRRVAEPAADGTRARDSMKGALLGPRFEPAEVRAMLDRLGAPYRRLEPADVPATAARILADGKVLGFFQGRMEYGPRALGARSILGDPRSPAMQTVMNLKIKYRESFRPFAPAVLVERIADWFDLDRPSPYMLLVAQVAARRRREVAGEADLVGLARLKAHRSEVPAITHVDGSARIQSVDGVHDPTFHAVLAAFEELTGCGVLVNTSFNVRGEPIVCTPEDAWRCFMNTEMDYLLVEDALLDKREQPKAGAGAGRPAFPLD
ncbi:MAG: carbamoyltransferase [Deltaproteobacteria bacterium]|nr:carbamoyltransferase [Deltaproteobacteria bacterium]